MTCHSTIFRHRGQCCRPHLVPFVSFRALGKAIASTAIHASVVKETVERAESGLKALVDFACKTLRVTLRDAKALYDLPTQRFAFRSFEIAFRLPDVDIQLLDSEGIVRDDPAELFRRISELLRSGLQLAQEEDYTLPLDHDIAEHQRIVLDAARKFSPSGKSTIDSIEISGSLVGPPNSKPIVVGPRTHKNATKALKILTDPDPNTLFRFHGHVRVAAQSKAPLVCPRQ